jgi:hypothetical protein
MTSSGFISPCSSTSSTSSSDSSSDSSSSNASNVSHMSAMALHHRLEELKDMYTVMLRQEATTYKICIPEDDDDAWRPLMVAWMYNIVDIFQLVPQVVGSAMYYLDKAHPLVRTPSDYQLLGLTALQLGIKVHETKLFPIEQLVRIGNSGFSVDDVIRMEQRLLVHLEYKLHPPTAECFVLSYYELLPKNADILRQAFDSVRRAMVAVDSGSVRYSVLAYASLLVAMESATSLSLEQKKTFGWNMMQLAGLTADSPGLVEAYEWLAPSSSTTCPMPAKPSPRRQPSQEELQPEDESQSEDESDDEESHETEVIFGTEDGIEVQWFNTDDAPTPKELELHMSASFSPRQVAY